jgi:hypothetical protein
MKKKIALIGNMNNNCFAVARYLEKSYQVDLILLCTEQAHFLPENDSFEIQNFNIIESRLSQLPSEFFGNKRDYILNLLSQYDLTIGCGPAPAYMSRINKKLDLFIPYGSDIYYIPFIPIFLKKGIKRLIKEQFFKYHQKRGILKSSHILMDYTNQTYESLFQKLNINKKRIFNNCPFLYVPEFNTESIKSNYSKSKFYSKFAKLRQENDLLIFHHSRHEWNIINTIEVKIDNHTKGNNKLILGFASYLKNANLKAHLILFEYGSSVELSKKLIQTLNIENHVTWMPLMPRKEIMVGISLCDIGVGELDTSYFSYGAIYEFLAMSKPVIHYRIDSEFEEYYPEMYPMYSANTAEQVEKYFMDYELNPSTFAKTGDRANKWFLKYAIEKPLNVINKIINEKK